jgi:AbrB family looped-hinge helix DNA binding protein
MVVKVSPKYQVVIPEDVRKTLGILPGSRVEVIAKGRVAYLVPVLEMDDLQNTMAGGLDLKGLRVKKDRKI